MVLWEPKQKYRRLTGRGQSIHMTCGGFENYIPYERLYGSLTQEQLLSLIKDARRFRWQALDLTSCGLEELPDALWELPHLKLLYLGNPEQRRTFRVDYRDNTFPVLPRKIQRLGNLRVLSLTNLPVQIEGDGLLRLPMLQHLDIFDCGFPQVPAQLLLPWLEGIGFNCPEAQLHDSFVSMGKLRQIYLSGSGITELPENFGSLSDLEVLDLHDAPIISLPASLLELRDLSVLHLHGTPLEDSVPPEILKQSPKEILRYYLAQQSDADKLYFNEAKMIIVGQGHVGKTSLRQRLVDDTYTEKKSTEGIDITKWYFNRGGDSYRLNVWDFGGQEIYHATHQFFLTRRALYLLVWDALAEDEYGRIDYWLKTIQSFADESPILIVVNKCDADVRRIQRIELEEYRKRFPQIIDVVYVSCKDNRGIHELRQQVEAVAAGLPLMKTSWLAAWLRVRQQLEALAEQKNFISYSEYLKLCKPYDIDQEEARSLIKYLHELGVVLYYHDDPMLKNLVILSSEWGTDAVYKVLDEQEALLKGRDGILHTSDLPEIWTDSQRYPQERYGYLLSLMKKFQLAFEINADTYLVAELLDSKPIVQDWSFEPGSSLEFRYAYDFIPAGVMTRFIVAINQNLQTVDGVKQCWKKGAYLRYHSAYARVELHDSIDARFVQIQVGGVTARHRQELLTIIRNNFDTINSQFRQIKIKERIPCVCTPGCDFLFDYETLLRAEEMGKPSVECHHSLQDVPISVLLDGVETKMENYYGPHVVINNNPQFNQTTTTTTTATATNTTSVAVTVEVRDLINGMHGSINFLKGELEESPEAKTLLEKLGKTLLTLDGCQTKEDVARSGAMEALERFLQELHEGQSTVGKAVGAVKGALATVNKLAGMYNKLAKWTALPQLPFGDK